MPQLAYCCFVYLFLAYQVPKNKSKPYWLFWKKLNRFLYFLLQYDNTYYHTKKFIDEIIAYKKIQVFIAAAWNKKRKALKK